MAGYRHDEQPAVIRSADNQIIKLVRSLRQRKTREAEQLFVLEGLRLVREALSRGLKPRSLLIREDKLEVVRPLGLSGEDYQLVDGRLFDSVANTVTPQGVIAVLEIPISELPNVALPLIVVADRISDPGNLGTLIRVGAGAGAAAIVLTEGSVDPYNPKVVRAGMGAHFILPIFWLDEEIRSWLETTCATRVLAVANGKDDYAQLNWTIPTALIVGPETGEFSEEARSLATTSARIPLAGGIESLNAAIAGAVMLFEANRQRRAAQQA